MISILIPIYNGIEFIDVSVGSVLKQTYTEWELLIGINGYSQNSEVYQTAKEYTENVNDERIKEFDFYTIKGKSETLNELVKYTKYDYISLLDVDDIWHPEKLTVQLQLIPYYDVIGSNCIWFGEREGIIPQIPLGDFSQYNFSLSNPVINSSVILKKKLCYWDPKCVLEDYDLWIRLRKQKNYFSIAKPF